MSPTKTRSSASAGEKHQTEHETPKSKRTKAKQPTIEESLSGETGQGDIKDENENAEDSKQHEASDGDGEGASEQVKNRDGSAVKEGEEHDMPSSILEKGIIYFFMRGRVGIDEPSSVDDIARSYMILRPIAKDAKLGEGPIGDAGNTRILAVPKKVLPKSGRDRFMAFVDKAGASYKEIKEEFLASSDYETKTAGTRHTPAATPVGEGVYAITTTGRESHLVYMLTLPEKRDEVQEKLGLKDQGSFILSTKNPKYGGPANARLPEPPKFPKEIIDEFRSLRWLPAKPEHIDYVNAQVLLIGESSGIEKATEAQEEDEKAGKKDPEEALEELEKEDMQRMKHLAGDQSAAIFADLEARAKDYPKIQTTF